MWTATLVIGVGGAGICALALVLGFIFGFFPKNQPGAGNFNPRFNQGDNFFNR
jgi:hypothetical protein